MAQTTATVQELQARLDALQKARDAGVLMIRHGDTSTQYRSLNEMNSIINDLKRQIDNITGVKRSKVNYVKQSNKGLGEGPLSASRLRRDFQ